MIHNDTALQELDTVVVRFAGDSGDGMQIVGENFTDTTAIVGNDISTFPDFPAEIRAPVGTLPGVSGFQIQFGNQEVLTAGDAPDALVAMNPAALKVNLKDLVPRGLLVVNTDSFTEAYISKAGFQANPLDDPDLATKYMVLSVPMTQLTTKALESSELTPTERAKCKNFFALGLLYWIYDRPIDVTIKWIESKWARKPTISKANSMALKTGYYYGETCEVSLPRYRINKAPVEKGTYRKIMGNDALVIGLIAASKQSERELFMAGYPITPASSILEGLAKHKNFGIKTIQAEDEIAAVGMSLGASFAGSLAITATSGPGLCLKSEAIGLAVITELPLVIVDCQRGGPSTGLPTKTEQTDLLQAMFGRNGESPLPVVAARSPADCFEAAFEACRIALFYRTPVILLSEYYLCVGSEPWKIPSANDLPNLVVETIKVGEKYVPYSRDPETLARRLAIPGRPGFEHRIGGLEKNEAGQVSYDPENHQTMVKLRAAKVEGIAKSYPRTVINGADSGKALVIGWGGTYGAITTAVRKLQKDGVSVSSVHLRHVNPLPLDLGDIMKRFDKIIMPELNMGQLSLLVRAKYQVNAIGINQVNGLPFQVANLVNKIRAIIG